MKKFRTPAIFLLISNIFFTIKYSYSQQDIPKISKGQLVPAPISIRSIKTSHLKISNEKNIIKLNDQKENKKEDGRYRLIPSTIKEKKWAIRM